MAEMGFAIGKAKASVHETVESLWLIVERAEMAGGERIGVGGRRPVDLRWNAF